MFTYQFMHNAYTSRYLLISLESTLVENISWELFAVQLQIIHMIIIDFYHKIQAGQEKLSFVQL